MFKPSPAKLSIGSLDNPDLSIDAHYNPKELSFSRSVPWSPHPLANKNGGDQLEVEFTGAQPRTMDLELLFDGYESATSVQDCIDVIETLASVRKAEGEADERRPHYCVVAWGDGGLKRLRCVIESVTVKYTMFDRIGTPLRAVANVKVREAHLSAQDVEGADQAQMKALRQRMAKLDRDR
jgi:hypothetical protein